MVNAENLFFAKKFPEHMVEFFCRCIVMSERFFNEDSCPAFTITAGDGQTIIREVLENGLVEIRRNGQVKKFVGAALETFGVHGNEFLLEALIALGIVKISFVVGNGFEELPELGAFEDRQLAAFLFLCNEITVSFVGHRTP